MRRGPPAAAAGGAGALGADVHDDDIGMPAAAAATMNGHGTRGGAGLGGGAGTAGAFSPSRRAREDAARAETDASLFFSTFAASPPPLTPCSSFSTAQGARAGTLSASSSALSLARSTSASSTMLSASSPLPMSSRQSRASSPDSPPTLAATAATAGFRPMHLAQGHDSESAGRCGHGLQFVNIEADGDAAMKDEDEDLEMASDDGQYMSDLNPKTDRQGGGEDEEEELMRAFAEPRLPCPTAVHRPFPGRRAVTPDRPSNPMAQVLAIGHQQSQQHQQYQRQQHQQRQQRLTLSIPQGVMLRPIQQSPGGAWAHGVTRSPHGSVHAHLGASAHAQAHGHGPGMIGAKRNGEASPLPMLMSSDYFSPRKMKRSSMLDSGRSNSLSSQSSLGSLGADSLTRSTSGHQPGKFWSDASSMARAPSRSGRRDLDDTSMYGSDMSLLDDSSEPLFTPREGGGERSRTFSIQSLSPSPRPGPGSLRSSTPKPPSSSMAHAAARSVDGLSPLRDVMRQVGL